ncbi:MAG: hypothetical protein NVSMB28_17320 [Collimonas sp.]
MHVEQRAVEIKYDTSYILHVPSPVSYGIGGARFGTTFPLLLSLTVGYHYSANEIIAGNYTAICAAG